MEEWVHRAIKRWPNVPVLYGWLRLDRRGRWLIKDELISRPQIIDTINRNYAADDRGCWYFQNGPQRGYVQLDYAPFVLRADQDANRGKDALITHTDLSVQHPTAAFMDETGALILQTEHGPAALIDDELEWALRRMQVNGAAVNEDHIAAALALPSGAVTQVTMDLNGRAISISRLDAGAAPAHLHFVRNPQP